MRVVGTEFADVNVGKLGKPALTMRPMTKALKVTVVVARRDEGAAFEWFLTDSGYQIVGRCIDTDDIVARVARWQPHVILIDAKTPCMKLTAKLGALHRAAPHLRTAIEQVLPKN